MQLPASHGDAPLTTEGPVSACGCLPANRQHRAGRKDQAVSSVLRDGMGPEGLFLGRSRVSVLACSGSGDCGGTVRVCRTPRHDEHTTAGAVAAPGSFAHVSLVTPHPHVTFPHSFPSSLRY